MGKIYKITSPSNKIYIGQTTNYEIRYKYYKTLRCKNQTKLLNSFKKYGVDNHIFEIIEECDIEQLNERERYYQEYFNCVNKGLNCRFTTTKDKSGLLSNETKNKMSKAAMGRIVKDETKLKLSIINKNKIVSKETRDKMSKTRKNKLINGKQVICTETNQIWNSAKKASLELNLNYPSLLKKLSGLYNNKTTLKYINYE